MNRLSPFSFFIALADGVVYVRYAGFWINDNNRGQFADCSKAEPATVLEHCKADDTAVIDARGCDLLNSIFILPDWKNYMPRIPIEIYAEFFLRCRPARISAFSADR